MSTEKKLTAMLEFLDLLKTNKIFKNQIISADYLNKEEQQMVDFARWFNHNDNTYKSYDEIVKIYYNETFKN